MFRRVGHFARNMNIRLSRRKNYLKNSPHIYYHISPFEYYTNVMLHKDNLSSISFL